MSLSSFKKAAVSGLLLICLAGFTGCDSAVNTQYDHPGSSSPASHLKLTVGVARVGSLAKTSTISLKRLVIVLISDAKDTLVDTVTTATSPALNTSATGDQNIFRDYALTPLRLWKVIALTQDMKDSVIHADSASTPLLYAGDTSNVSLNLGSRFSMYDVKFLNIPDSIGSATGTAKQALHINRIVLKVDGKIVVDSSKTYFIPNSTVDLKYDYVTVNQVHTIELQAYGIVNSITPASQLFDGSTTFTATSGLDASIPLTLNWVGPTTGKASLSVLIGKVGQITVNATATGVLIP